MSKRSILHNYNIFFLICGVGCINYGQRNIMTKGMFYFLRYLLICLGLFLLYDSNQWIFHKDQEMSEATSFIMISCFELMVIGKFISIIWRVFFDKELSITLSNIEKIDEKLNRLNMTGPMKIKMNWFFIVKIILHVIASIITVMLDKNFYRTLNVCQLTTFYEYILLTMYIRWMVNMINENIRVKKSCLSTFRDMYLEVEEYLNHINKSIYGLPAITTFVALNICDIIPQNKRLINRMNLVLHQRFILERNPRIKRQIKFFILRRLYKHFRFELFGICHINQRQLLILLNKALAYLIIQILFKLN
ncbi:uncharacterized protein LOC112600720 [Melanaphis sacchari]|uniref:uncharacterized protein LOC112600720 n=1 Tax=Melanaphis sacchari TaxID=742174 RepID=UPI000DC13FED|nr:uncharacterized protein LOC112600720 [Melanaphis sacchari]